MKTNKIPKNKSFEQGEITVDADTQVLGLTIWLGTKNKKVAMNRIRIVCDFYNKGEKSVLKTKNRKRK